MQGGVCCPVSFEGNGNMKMLIEFDVDADIIDVPESVIAHKDSLRSKFWRWLSDKSIKHKYWKKVQCSDGTVFHGLCFRSDAFVEWLNKKILKESDEKATILEECVSIGEHRDLPSIFF